MLCEKCKKNNATKIVSKTSNSKTTVANYCDECAFKAGYSNIFGEFSLNNIMLQIKNQHLLF